MKTFPTGFIWGTATSAHQIEGNNTNSDWWQWEQNKKAEDKYPLEPSGIACDSYNRYPEDFDWCKKLNTNAVRLSIEWARLEPKQGVFSEEEFQHYRQVLQAAKDRGLKTFVTLHHFTNPLWLADMGGWGNRKSAKLFAIYAATCAQKLDDLIDVYMTINEPQVLTSQAYINGMWPPNKENPFVALWVQRNLVRAHNLAYTAIKKHSTKPVGIVKNTAWFFVDPTSHNPLDHLMCRLFMYLNCDSILNQVRKYSDFIGLNYYFTNRLKNFLLTNANDWTSDLGWWIYPKGLEELLKYLKKYQLPIYITENGLADSTDTDRKEFIRQMLTGVHEAIGAGVDVRGYFHWSLLDNFEWHAGFWPRFGLLEVDRQTLTRTPRTSAQFYADICQTNSIK